MAEQAYIDEIDEGGRYNDGDNLTRNRGGGGGGGGGGSSTVSIISGCMDKSATNYNSRATSPKNSTCKYPTKTTTPLSESRTISVTVKSNNGGTVMIDGTDTLKTVTTGFNYTGKELLTPKFFKVRKSGFTTTDEYKLYSQKRKFTKEIRPLVEYDSDDFDDSYDTSINLMGEENRDNGDFIYNDGRGGNINFNKGNGQNQERSLGYSKGVRQGPKERPILSYVDYDYYEFRLEKNGNEIPLLNQINKITDTINKVQIATLEFDLAKDIIINETLTTPIKINIESNTSADDIIYYTTSWGKSGYLIDDDDFDLEYTPSVFGEKPTISFTSKGISDFTHTVTYTYDSPSSRSKISAKRKDLELNLEPGQTNILVDVTKVPVEESPDAPAIKADITQVKFNIASDDNIKIPYTSINSEKVTYTLGNTVREIDLSGSLILENSDFYNGVGNYIIYLQPSSQRGGSGNLEKINVTVESRAYLPGPDITNINYPQNIKGADFKGYNVPFDISWQSINTNYIHVYVGKKTNITSLGKFAPSGLTTLNVGDVLTKLKAANLQSYENKDIVQFSLILIPYNEEGDSLTEGKTEEINITFDKGDLTLRRGNVISDLRTAFTSGFDYSLFDDSISPFLTHYLHLGDGNNKLIGTWGIDDDTLSTFEDNLEDNTRKKTNTVKSLVLKLYEPLPANINTNDKVWISKLQAIPLIDQITIINDISKNCTPLTPNFALETNDVIGYQILDDLISSGSTTSTDVINQFVSSSEFSLENLDIQFTTSSKILVESNTGGGYYEETDSLDYYWKNFIKYSSAEERVENFVYKVRLIESYQTKYNGLVSGSNIDFGNGDLSSITGSASSSVEIRNEANRTLGKIGDTKKGFDAFEKYLYTKNDSLTYPGAGGNSISSSDDSTVADWYGGIIASAKEYDYSNSDRFVNNLPEHITSDTENQSFTLFFDMVGQHFDVLYTHIKGINQTRKLEHKFEKGINGDLVYHMLESLGFDADLGSQSQLLWEYAFGKHSDGTQVSSMSGKDRQTEQWRRILNNLPYLYKHKGTKRAISAALSCYGIPQSLLTVMEFGGPQNVKSSGTTSFTFEDRTASINISGSASIISPWKSHNSYYPESVEVRLNTEQKQDQRIISSSGWSVDIEYPDSGSLASFTLNILNGSQYVSASSEKIAFFNDEYTQIVINRETGSIDDTITVFVKEGFNDRIRNYTTASIQVPNSDNGWENGSTIQLGGSTLTASVDEFRLWSTPLSDSVITNHTLLPDAINGNHISSSTEDLLFRLDFEYPKDRSAAGDPYIKNVSVNNTYELFATASNFSNSSSYPYQYTAYDRNVTAQVPSSGFNVGNKVRFESQTLVSDLSYKQRATKKSFDQSPLDSDRLGLFFSPIKEINMDIMKSLGGFNIDDYIGDPSDDYNHEYKNLSDLRNYYFKRFELNLSEYIQLVRYIDKSLFEVLESLVPGRAKVSSGLLIEPHILERSKVELKPTVASRHDYNAEINTLEDANVFSSNEGIDAIVKTSDITVLSGKSSYYESIISSSSPNLVGSPNMYDGSVVVSDDTNQFGYITVNSGSNMGGISITVDAQFTGSIQGEYDATAYTQVGFEPNSLAVAGFGIYSENGHSIVTKLDKDNNFTKSRKRIDIVTEQYTVDVPQNINPSDSSMGREFITKTFNRQKLTIRDFSQNASLISGNIIAQVPLNGYVPYHYRNVGDLTSGMENSFFNGSKQTSSTTLDGTSPVQTFTTNPNTLRVSDTGRGSGEPILQVD